MGSRASKSRYRVPSEQHYISSMSEVELNLENFKTRRMKNRFIEDRSDRDMSSIDEQSLILDSRRIIYNFSQESLKLAESDSEDNVCFSASEEKESIVRCLRKIEKGRVCSLMGIFDEEFSSRFKSKNIDKSTHNEFEILERFCKIKFPCGLDKNY